MCSDKVALLATNVVMVSVSTAIALSACAKFAALLFALAPMLVAAGRLQMAFVKRASGVR